MNTILPTEICESLAFRICPDYKFIKFQNCEYNESKGELKIVFLYDESIKHKLESLTIELENKFRETIHNSIPETRDGAKIIFKYNSSYMDSMRLELVVSNFLTQNFSIMTLGLGNDDVKISLTDRAFDIEINLPKHIANFVRSSKGFEDFKYKINEDYFYAFNFVIIEKETNLDDTESLADIERMVAENLRDMETKRVNKALPIKNMEYYLGKPIKERPVKLEFLRTSPDEQVTAGIIHFLTQREFTKKTNNESGEEVEEKKVYWTFTLDDGYRKHNCVFFPNTKTLAPFEKLTNGTTVCVIGVNDERNGRTNMSVKGVSLCELG